MKLHARLSACLFTITVLAAVAALLYLDRNPQPTDRTVTSLQDSLRLSRELDGRMADAQHSNRAKEAITADVIAGRMTLFEAAAAFQTADMRRLDFQWEMFCRSYPGGSDGERYCRAVIKWVRQRLPEESSQAEAVLARLEAELQDHLNQHGTVILPPL